MEEAETAAKVAKTADTAAETAATVEKMAETETAATVEKTAETETAATAATETADTAAETAATETAETAAETAATAAETAATDEKTAETAAETAATAAETAATETAETAAETAETAAETAATAAETAATAAAGAFELGKLFVGGISSETREEALEEYFGAYGELKEAVVMRDRVTGNPRGFGFIHFAGPEAADEALKAGKHVILGKTVEVKRAIPRGDLNQTDNHGSNRIPSGILTNYNFIGGNYNNGSGGGGGGHYNSRKIFIGGLPESINEDEFCSYFKKFGNVTDTVIMHDSMTHRPRGFGFVTFDSPEAVENVLKSDHELNGKMVDVKKAVPKDGNNINNGIGHDNNIQSSRSFNGRRNSFVDPKCMVYPQTQSYHHMPNPNLDFVNYPGTGYMMPRGYMNGYGPYGVMYYGMPMPGPSPPWTPRWNPANNNTSNYWDMANAHHWNGNNMANKAVSYVEIPSIGSRSSSPAECGSECSVNQTG